MDADLTQVEFEENFAQITLSKALGPDDFSVDFFMVDHVPR